MGILKYEQDSFDNYIGLTEYEQHLFDEETMDGYIQVMQISKNKKIKVFNTKNANLREIVEEFDDNYNIYVTPNTTFIPKRGTRNIRQFRSLFQDIDCEKKGITKEQAIFEVWEMYQNREIPQPSMITDSGRGIHLYWKIEHAPYAAIKTWQELQDYFYYRLKHLGADRQATDGARILRVPGTINSKNRTECTVINIENDLIYSMYELREEYLEYTPRETQVKWFIEDEHTKETKKDKPKVIKNKFFNSYSLHMARAEDIETLCKLREYDMHGCRNMTIHCYAYWKGIIVRNEYELAELVHSLNDKFIEPLKDSEIEAILKCIPKAIDKFIAYEQGIRNGENKRVSKEMKDTGGYWYKNATLIDRLNITREEQSKLKTIIGIEEKYDRNNERRRKERRNENGLTSREQTTLDLTNKVKELKSQGLKQKEVAEKLGKGIATIKRHWNK